MHKKGSNSQTHKAVNGFIFIQTTMMDNESTNVLRRCSSCGHTRCDGSRSTWKKKNLPGHPQPAGHPEAPRETESGEASLAIPGLARSALCHNRETKEEHMPERTSFAHTCVRAREGGREGRRRRERRGGKAKEQIPNTNCC